MARLREHPALAQHHPLLQAREETAGAVASSSPSLLQRLEWMLYHSAGSMGEYLHPESLERRVQALVTHYKRKRSELDPDDATMALINSTAAVKRPRLIVSQQEISHCSVGFGARGCVLNSNLDLLRHVCSFLDGREVLRCRAVDKFLYVHAPSFVRSLHLEASTATVSSRRTGNSVAALGLCDLLHECENLQNLTISNRSNLAHLKAGVVFPRALTASSYMASLAPASYGYQLVREVSRALEGGACPALETLELLAPFDFAIESDAVLLALRPLAEIQKRKPLRHLVLNSTFLGDRGIAQLSELLETKAQSFSKLRTLVVSNNFMGETGCRSLLKAIENCADLQTLDLSRNILTDTDALALADLLDDPTTASDSCEDLEGDRKMEDAAMDQQTDELLRLRGLRTLLLQENFITCDGFHAITIALCARRGFVATISGSTDDEEDEEDEEDELFEDEDEDELMDME
ncbi:hypothetical protein BBJ28_00003924 [Nothophytophthora sp. Chile5]|nr:hypothetical protein BBJ28_00003924 [Nothophytophthora sp. Chile5]